MKRVWSFYCTDAGRKVGTLTDVEAGTPNPIFDGHRWTMRDNYGDVVGRFRSLREVREKFDPLTSSFRMWPVAA